MAMERQRPGPRRVRPEGWRAWLLVAMISAGWAPAALAASAPDPSRTLEAAPRWTASPGFERPAGLGDEIAFWVRIYSQVTTHGGLIHDDRHLSVVYEQLDFPPGTSTIERRRVTDRARNRHATALRMVAARLRDLPAGEALDPASLSPDELLAFRAWPDGTSAQAFEAAATRLRFQLGQRDRFLEGYIRAGAWEGHLAEVMERLGLPPELAALPHVESSFNVRAYSKVGAAGIWQFMPATGRRWLRIDEAVDERRDPYRSTVAAARFLQQNHRILGTWPLALTAYNHGPGGLRRAAREMGTTDITTLVKAYQGPAFGFASRNFFPSFMAALEVDRNAAWYFGDVQRDPPDDTRVVVLPEYVPAASLARAFGIDKSRLRELNLPLMGPIWEGRRYVPKGYALRVPADARPTAEALRSLRPNERFAGQMREPRYKVRRGDTLSVIAKRFGTTPRWLLANNGLKGSRQVKRGMLLRVPGLAAGPPARGAHMPWTPPAENVFLAGLPARPESGPVAVVAAAAAEESAAVAGEAIAMSADESPEPVVQESDAAETASSEGLPVDVPAAESPAAAEPLAEAPGEDGTGPGLMPGVTAAASADPTDYSIAADGTLVVLGAETLGQLASWLGTDVAQLRRLNGLKPKAPLVMGRRLKVELAGVSPTDFERARTEWHRAQQAVYFERVRIVGADRHRLQTGESLWSLMRQHGVPAWLLQQYNPDLDFSTLKVGMEINVPRIDATTVGESG